MKGRIFAATILIALVGLGAGAYTGTFAKDASFPLQPGSRLKIDMPVGEFSIRGTTQANVSVHLRVDVKRGSVEDAQRDIEIRWRPGAENRLEIHMPQGMKSWGHKVDLHAEIRVPARVDLNADLGVGELRVENVSGNLRAHTGVGQIRLSLPDVRAYRSVRAEAGVGNVQHPFEGETTGWVGKEFRRQFDHGEYRLDAEVGVGDVQISGSKII